MQASPPLLFYRCWRFLQQLSGYKPLQFSDLGVAPKMATGHNLASFPNPMTDRTTIAYLLDNESLVQLEVFSISGKRIAVLKNEKQAAGEYTIEYDGSDLPAGIYFARLTTGGKQMETVKFFKQ